MLSSIFKASAAIELKIFSTGDVWSVVISFFLALRGTFFMRQKFGYISLVHRIYTFIMKNINKTLKKNENVNDDGNK